MTHALEDVCVTPHEFVLPGTGAAGRTGVLLVHGLTGTPNEMRLLAKGLHRQGFTVYAVQLAGHCGAVEDLLATRWQDWYASVAAGADRLAPHVDRLVVGGLSMGAVLSLALAQERPRQVAGVCALSTIFRYDGWSMPVYTRLSFLLPLFRRLGIGRRSVFMEQPPYGIKDEALRKRIVAQMHAGDSAAAGLPGNPWWSVIEMRRLSARVLSRLGSIQAPCLVIHAREDDVSTLGNARAIVQGVRQAPVELVVLEDSYHMITVDRERRTVIATTAAFVARLAAGPGTPAAPALAGAVARG
ncbi:alpha/beta fold hydrolase [uncultured Xylophilus sp.]|uniref:alpha/beta hydrolase n=1 Tax=uncultured Xylophilus sp. TaxID=296832 RepID=UPI0025CBCC83|nr:alpha/beta fold hydrolase [uncultured Xylophilus sp.]